MKLWISRDTDDGDPSVINFWANKPRIIRFGEYQSPGLAVMCLTPLEFKSLTGLPLPRKGLNRQADVSIQIKDAKGAKDAP